MSKVSVTGTKNVVRDVIEVTHDQRVVHLSDYGGEFEGFDTGSPLAGADGASETLVTVRSLINILDVTGEDAGPARIVTDEALEEEFESVRRAVNDLDDHRESVVAALETFDQRIEEAQPFVELGIDLDLLWGYDSLDVVVGTGDVAEVEAALADADDVASSEVFSEGDTFAAFAYPTEAAAGDVASAALAGLDVERHEVPEVDRTAGEYLEVLENRTEKLRETLDGIEEGLRDLRLEHAGFLLAAEEKLTIEVEKAEAPLRFATTEHAFFAEGWLPTSDYEAYASALRDAVGDRVEVEELERADFSEERDVPAAGFAPAGEGVEGEERALTDGGSGATADEPPVVQNNPWFVKPFEVLVQAINRPNYHEIDPTIVLFFTFPLFFGFMIGDVGYGVVYALVGYALYSRFDSEAIASLGFVAMVAGAATVVFGLLYGEFFGVFLPYEPVLSRGLEPSLADWAELWLLGSVLAALVHLTVGYVFDFVKQLDHGVRAAVLESGSLVVVMLGIWLWVFSLPRSIQPAWLFTVLDGNPAPLGFAGFPPVAGAVGLWGIPIGLVLAYVGGGGIEAYEGLVNSITHVLSYTRLGAEVLAEGGIAFVVNLLFFGAYSHEGEYHYLFGQTASAALAHHPGASIMFPGLMHAGVAGVLGGIVVLLFGHLLVLALGVTSAGMQAIRLEYVEFFGKFYEGGGKKYRPFGHPRTYTTQD